MKKHIAVILSGCGVFDGSEIYEATLTFLAIEHNGSTYECFAPDIPQTQVINHLTGEVAKGETRNVLVESARLCRGKIKALTELKIEEFDGMIFPGGFGAASNLSDFATKGADAQVNDLVHKTVRSFADVKKPVGFICIAPSLVPLIYKKGVQVTIGDDAETIATISKMGAIHIECTVDDYVRDLVKKVISTPAFMLANTVTEANVGIEKMVTELISMCE
ncbi:MAG: isoprenoid biosynthesis glyoxalase ElbB [Algicola sp.]|nr:isoprenoid biosynthesis glyoxalase ElbB [Algicola sp.]